MLYKLLGLLTWKAIKRYVRRKVPARAVAAVTVAAGIAVVAAATRRREGDA